MLPWISLMIRNNLGTTLILSVHAFRIVTIAISENVSVLPNQDVIWGGEGEVDWRVSPLLLIKFTPPQGIAQV